MCSRSKRTHSIVIIECVLLLAGNEPNSAKQDLKKHVLETPKEQSTQQHTHTNTHILKTGLKSKNTLEPNTCVILKTKGKIQTEILQTKRKIQTENWAQKQKHVGAHLILV